MAYSGDGYTFFDGSSYTARDLKESAPGTPAKEFVVLIHSDNIYGWIGINNTSKKYAYSKLNQPSAYSSGEIIDVDAKSVGCKFTPERVKDELSRRYRGTPTNALVEHCWSLSNSCGEFVDPSDVGRFKKLTFGDETLHTDEDVSVGTRVGNYLAHCINLFDKSLTESNKGRTVMFEAYAKKIREYYKTSDLMYSKPTDNILLTGVIYDFLSHYNVSLSTYKSDTDNFGIFLGSYAPLIGEAWEFTWSSPPPDVKLMFEFTAQDLHVSLPYYNTNDAKIIIANTLRFVESVVERGPLTGLKEYISAILAKDNPSLSGEDLWSAFHCYYGIYRTGRTRAIPRPLYFVTPVQLGSLTVNMSGVEKHFSKLQESEPNINIRRQFCGSLAGEAFAVFRHNKISLSAISTLNIPINYGYLNVDYYKHVPASVVNDEEKVILSSIHKNVDQLCVDRNLSTNTVKTPKGNRNSRNKPKAGNAQRYRSSRQQSSLGKLHKELWDGVGRSNHSKK